jgi:hypothetical protein
MNARDHEARTAEITDTDPFDETTLYQARLTVCANSSTSEEAIELMLMLGLHPSQDGEVSLLTGPPPSNIVSLQPKGA